MNRIFGNLKAQQKTKSVLDSSEHSIIILSGNSGLGKFSYLKQIVDEIIEESDVFISDSSISNIRESIEFLSTNPVFSSNRVVIINNADNMMPAAQDACLKICEEPPDYAKIFLICTDEQLLSQALLSRVQENIYWSLLSNDEMTEFISSYELTSVDLKSICIPGLYKTILQNSYLNQLNDCIDEVLNLDDTNSIFKVPDCIKKIPNKSCSEREAASYVIRRSAIHSLSFISDRKKAKPFLDFSSVLLRFPSANAELHWQRACVLCKMSIHCPN